MKKMDVFKKVALNFEALENVSGGTGPLNYPYASCDPAMKETGPLNYPYMSNKTGPLGVRV